jgi:Tol biopolymer transport system component
VAKRNRRVRLPPGAAAAVATAGLVAAVGVGIGVPPPASALVPGRNGLIAYTDNDVDRDGQSAIMVVRPDGSGRRLIHQSVIGDDTGYGAFGAAWSPRGDRLAFSDYVSDPSSDPMGPISEQAVFVGDARGRGLRRLTPAGLSASEPFFAPGGGRLAFSGTSIEPSGAILTDIYSVAADGTGLVQLTHVGDATADGWLSNGRIAFFRTHGLFTMRADGSDVRRVPLTHFVRPNWSPLGRNLVFGVEGNVFIARGDGSHLRKLPNTTAGGDPAFSPDGKWIVFTRPGRDRGAGPQPELWLVDIHGHHAHRVIAEPRGPGGGYTVGAFFPAWQSLPR